MVSAFNPCPICGRQPDVDRCGPTPRGVGGLGWYASCFGYEPYEHHVGVNFDLNQRGADVWNYEVARVKAELART